MNDRDRTEQPAEAAATGTATRQSGTSGHRGSGGQGMRRLCAMVLVCEAIVIGLAIPVAIAVEHADATAAGVVGGVAAVGSVLLAGLLRYRWAFAAGSVLQVLVILSGFAISTMFFLGAIFGALWIAAIWLGLTVESG